MEGAPEAGAHDPVTKQALPGNHLLGTREVAQQQEMDEAEYPRGNQCEVVEYRLERGRRRSTNLTGATFSERGIHCYRTAHGAGRNEADGRRSKRNGDATYHAEPATFESSKSLHQHSTAQVTHNFSHAANPASHKVRVCTSRHVLPNPAKNGKQEMDGESEEYQPQRPLQDAHIEAHMMKLTMRAVA